MKAKFFLPISLVMALLASCLSSNNAITGEPTQPSSSTNSNAPPVYPTGQTETATLASTLPAPKSTIESETSTPWDVDQMPAFLEVTQTTTIGDLSGENPAIGVGPATYFYSLDQNVLMLHPTVKLNPGTELLIGMVIVLQTSGQVFENREVVQFPIAQPTLLRILTFDAETNTLTIQYRNEEFDLSTGENRTFKQFSDDSNTPTVITTISNHGRLSGIEQITVDGSQR